MSSVDWQVTDGYVEARSKAGRLRWKGRPQALAAQKVLTWEGGRDCIVLCEPSDGSEANLLRLAPSGDIVWRIEPPDKQYPDAWLYAGWSNQHRRTLTANSWSCYYARIDRETGEILHLEFTK